MKSVLPTILTIIASLLAGCDWNSAADGALPEYLHVVTVQPADLQNSFDVAREFAGQVESSQNPTIAFELPGTLNALLVNVGDSVSAGQILARLDTQLLDAERQELEARQNEINTELSLARRNLARIAKLQEDQLASERERDELSSRVDLLAASLQRNQANLDGNRIRLEKSQLRAPFDARVQLRLADEGTVVDAGAPVFNLVETGRREVRAGLPAHLVKDLTLGDSLPIRVGDLQASGELIAIGAVVDPATRSQVVRLMVSAEWSPGELAYVTVAEPLQQAGTWLPDTAVTEGLRGSWVVYVAIPSGDLQAILEKRSVTVHHASQGKLFVSGALSENDLVVSNGLHRVAPGQRVRLNTPSVVSHARKNP